MQDGGSIPPTSTIVCSRRIPILFAEIKEFVVVSWICDEFVSRSSLGDGLGWTRLEQNSGDFASYLAEASESDPLERLFLESFVGNDSGFIGVVRTYDGVDLWASQDGIEWSKRPSADAAPQPCFQWLGGWLVAADTSFVAWQTCNEPQDSGPGQDDSFSRYYSAVWTSDDGRTWTTTTFDPGVRTRNVVAVGPTFVAVGGVTDNLNSEPDEEDYRPMIWTSTDGSTWVPVDLGIDGVGAGTLSQVVVGGPGLAAWGESPDGPTLWVAVPGITP